MCLKENKLWHVNHKDTSNGNYQRAILAPGNKKRRYGKGGVFLFGEILRFTAIWLS
jgi:hypothetical protein